MLPLFETRCGSDVGVSTTAPRAARRRIESGKSDIRRAGSDSLGSSVRRPGSCRRVRTSQRRMPRMSTSARTRSEQPRQIRSQTPGRIRSIYARWRTSHAPHMRNPGALFAAFLCARLGALACITCCQSICQVPEPDDPSSAVATAREATTVDSVAALAIAPAAAMPKRRKVTFVECPVCQLEGAPSEITPDPCLSSCLPTCAAASFWAFLYLQRSCSLQCRNHRQTATWRNASKKHH